MEALPSNHLSLSQFTTMRLPFADDLKLVRQCGFAGLEVCESKLSSDRHKAADELKFLRDSGIPVCSVQARVHAVFPDQMAPEPSDPASRTDAFVRSMDRFREALPDQIPTFVLISGRAPEHDFAQSRRTLVAKSAQLAAAAAQRGLRIAFEPLNPVLMNVDTFVCHWDEAARLVETVANDHLGLVCDLWNVGQESCILANVSAAIDRIFLVHASDWRVGGPRRLNDRLPPGRGAIPWADWGSLFRRARYAGWVGLEMLSDPEIEDSYYHRPMADVLNESRQTLESAGWFAR